MLLALFTLLPADAQDYPTPEPTYQPTYFPTTIPTCDSARDLADLMSPYSGSTRSSSDDFQTSCGGNGHEVFFFAYLQPGTSIAIQQTANTYDSRHELSYGDTCPGATSIACRDDPDHHQEQWTNDQEATVKIWFMIDAYKSQRGDFTIEWTIDCCKDLTAWCLSCFLGVTREEYCTGSPSTPGCPSHNLAAPPESGKLSVTSGSCTVSNSGDCLNSPNFPQKYGDNRLCLAKVIQTGVLRVVDFQVEECCDLFYVDNVHWIPNEGDTKRVAAGTEIKFLSDWSVSFDGFSICIS